MQSPLGSPIGGAVEQSETERGSRHLRFFEWSGEFVTTILCCHSTHPSKKRCCGGPLSQPLWAASSPNGGAKEASADSPWCIPNGILRTAGNPSGAMRRPPLSGEVRAQVQVMGEPVSVMAMKVRPWVRKSCWPSAVRKRKGLRASSHSQRMGMSLPPLAK